MLSLFFRSSALNDISLCEGRYWITYVLGRRGSNSRATLIGSITHATLESLALLQLAKQNNECSFTHSEFGVWYSILPSDEEELYLYSIDKFTKYIYDKYNVDCPNLLEENDLEVCLSLVKKAVDYSGGAFNPQNNTVFAVEHQFEYEFPQKWAAYKYETPDGPLVGQLKLMGTVDVVYKENNNTLHVVDYKTSKSISNWATDEDKTTENLHKDWQLLLYYYALAHEFPDFSNIIITLYFIKLDKPFTIAFERSELPSIEEVLRNKFEEIRSIDKPSFLVETPAKWKCRFCSHSKSLESTGETTCNFFRRELKQKGLEQTTWNFAAWDKVNSYGFGASNPERK